MNEKRVGAKLRKLDVFLEKEFSDDFEETCAALGIFVARLVCRHGWTPEMLERLFDEQVQLVRYGSEPMPAPRLN